MADEPQPSATSHARKIRWRAPLILLSLAAAAIIVIWSRDVSRQHHIVHTCITALVTLIVLLVWALLFSGFRGATRLKIFGGFVLGSVALAGLFEVTGVTGDMLPIVKPRWRKAAQPETIPAAATPRPASGAPSVSYPQFLGPNRDSIIPGVRLQTNWIAHPPQQLWRRAVGNGWSGFAIAEGLAITQEQRGEHEFVAACDLQTGAPVWTHTDPGRHWSALGGEGPRATPTIHSNRVYALGAFGVLNCLELASGKKIWSKNLVEEFQTNVPEWGYSGSPLIHSNLVVVPANSSSATLAAFDLDTGKTIWSGGSHHNGYSSPALLTLAGAPQIISFNNRNVSSHDPASGAVLWEQPWPATHPHITTPIAISTNTLLVSSGYGYGSELIEIARDGTNFTASRVWKSNRFKSKFANLVRYHDYVYGLDDGILAALDPSDGRRVWHDGRVGHGQLLLVGDVLLVMAESGEVLLVDPPFSKKSAADNSDTDRTIARLKVFDDKTWNPPAIAGEYLLVRNNLEAACFKLPLVKP